MIVQDILARVCRLLSLELADVLDDAERLDQFLGYINEAQRALVRRGDWAWLRTSVDQALTVDQDYVDLPSDFLGLPAGQFPRLTDTGAALCVKSMETLDQARTASASGGRPTMAAFEYQAGANLWRMILWPTPGEALTLRIPYRRKILPLADTQTSPLFPDELHEVLALLAEAVAEEHYHRVPVGARRGAAVEALEREWAAASNPVRDQQRIRLRTVVGEPPYPPMGEEPITSVRVEVTP